MTRPRRNSGRAVQIKTKALWESLDRLYNVTQACEENSGLQGASLGRSPDGKGNGKGDGGQLGIHSTLTAWSLWPSSYPQGDPPGLWDLGLPWLQGLWSLASAAACKALSEREEQESTGIPPGSGLLEDSENTKWRRNACLVGKCNCKSRLHKGHRHVTYMRLTYMRLTYMRTSFGRPHVSEQAQSLGCGPLAAHHTLSLPTLFEIPFFFFFIAPLCKPGSWDWVVHGLSGLLTFPRGLHVLKALRSDQIKFPTQSQSGSL